MATWVCATCGPVPAGEIRHLDHDSPHGHERHECGSSAGLDWTTKEHEMFKTETCVSVRCDHCGDGLEYDGHIPHFTTQDEAMDAAREYEWTFTRDGAAYCDPSETPACTCDGDCNEDCPVGCPCVLHDEIKAPEQDALFAQGTAS